jgi:hypothetical protein
LRREAKYMDLRMNIEKKRIKENRDKKKESKKAKVKHGTEKV